MLLSAALSESACLPGVQLLSVHALDGPDAFLFAIVCMCISRPHPDPDPFEDCASAVYTLLIPYSLIACDIWHLPSRP